MFYYFLRKARVMLYSYRIPRLPLIYEGKEGHTRRKIMDRDGRLFTRLAAGMGGFLTAVLLTFLVIGVAGPSLGWSAAAEPAIETSGEATASPTPNASSEGPGAEVPTSAPDRVSDHPSGDESAPADSVVSPTPSATPEPQVYGVVDGDTLAKISREFGVSVDSLVTKNGILDPNLIYRGSALQIPEQ
jgi:LysM repeat protein